MSTTFRADVAAGLKSVLDTFKAANPTLVRATFIQRPTAPREFPTAYVGERSETVSHDAGTRRRTMSPTVVVVDSPTDPDAVMGRMDIVVDALLDALTAQTHLASGVVWRGIGSITDTVEQVGDAMYPAVVITLVDVEIEEGRT